MSADESTSFASATLAKAPHAVRDQAGELGKLERVWLGALGRVRGAVVPTRCAGGLVEPPTGRSDGERCTFSRRGCPTVA